MLSIVDTFGIEGEDEEFEFDVSFYFLPVQFAKDPEIALLGERTERVRRRVLLVS